MSISFPKLFKYTALVAFLGVLVYLVTYLISRNQNSTTRRKPTVSLTQNLSAVSNDFRYVHKDGNVDRLILTAKKDTAYASGQHLLEEVKLEGFDEQGKPTGTLTSKTAEYDQQKQVAVFKSDVVVTTADALVVRTEEMKYDQAANTASTDVPVSFERKNVTGTCVGVTMEPQKGRFVMVKDVKVTIAPESPDDAKPSGSPVAAPSKPAEPEPDKPKKDKKDKKNKKNKEGKRKKEKESLTASAPAKSPFGPSKEIKETVVLTGNHAEYWKPEKRILLDGNAKLVQGGDELRGDKMTAHLDDKQRIKQLEVRSNSFLKSEAKHGQVEAKDMDFVFNEAGDVERATATGNPVLKTVGDGPAREVYGDRLEVVLVPNQSGNVVDLVTATGNARVKLLAPPASPAVPQPAEKELTAETVTVKFASGGQFAETAAAQGNAVLTVKPVVVEPRADQKQIRAPRMTAAFFESGNLVRTFKADGGVKVELTPLEAATKRLLRVTQSDRATADFDRASQDVAEVVQEGKFTFNEGVRNAVSDRATYVKARETVFLRGGRPTVWDDKARTQANELDLTVGDNEHFARGEVRTTYYNPAGAGNSTPFAKAKSPIFITSNEARADAASGKAVYRGDARVWQDDNFVRGDTVELFQTEKKMTATGHVSSALYRVERTDAKGRKSVVPIFGTSESFTYSDTEKQARYQGNVRLVQGEDTLTSETADIFLNPKTNDIDRTVAVGKVVITQPGRRATGDRAEYTASDERFVVTGNSARVEDAERGTTTGPRLTFVRSDGSVLAVDQRRTQRIRTTHKVEN